MKRNLESLGIFNYSQILLSFLLIAWTASVFPYSKYGDNWAITPALLIFPSAVALHFIILIRQGFRLKLILYSICHLAVLFIIWVLCLMLISKDSL